MGLLPFAAFPLDLVLLRCLERWVGGKMEHSLSIGLAVTMGWRGQMAVSLSFPPRPPPAQVPLLLYIFVMVPFRTSFSIDLEPSEVM